MEAHVYVVTHFVHCYSDASTETVGVDSTLDAAKLRALQRKFADMTDHMSMCRDFDPVYRFVQAKSWSAIQGNTDQLVWQDEWRYAPYAEIEIESWIPGAKSVDSIIRCNLDEVIRDKIVTDILGSQEVGKLVARYANEIEKGCIPSDLSRAFVTRAEAGPRRQAEEAVRVEWVEQHGSKGRFDM